MWMYIVNFLILSLSASRSLATDGNERLTKSWSSFNSPASTDHASNFESAFDNFGFENTQNAAGKNKNNHLVYVNPFVKTFATKSYPAKYYKSPNQFNQHPRRLNTFVKPQNHQRQTRPVYAPTYVHHHSNGNNNRNYGASNPQKKIFLQPQSQNSPPTNFGSYRPPQQFSQSHITQKAHLVPVSTQYKTFHPYKANSVKLEQYYNDPYYKHVKAAVDANERRLQSKEQPPKTEVNDEEESEDEPDNEGEQKFQKNEEQENFTPQYEEHVPQNAPIYYQPPEKQVIDYNRIQNKLVYPQPNQQHIKIHPNSYSPLKHQISSLKSNQGKTFSDENSDYPALTKEEDNDNKEPDGHDIFERQESDFNSEKANFNGNFDSFLRNHHENAPVNVESPRKYLEDDDESSNENDDFVPVKMYAQVRRTETTKHLPREAAAEDAETYDDFLNAPRLRQAIKTSKAQTVYTEEGYEDNAYDHAGHLKQASNHEGHGGYVKGKEAAAGKYKDGSEYKYQDGGRKSHGQDTSNGKKWFNDQGKDDEFENQESFEENDGEHESKTNDLDEAGSEKKGVKKISFLPKISQKSKGNSNKLVMTADSEQTMVKDTDDGGIMVNTRSRHISMNNDPPGGNEKPKYVRLRPNYYWKRPKKANFPDEIFNKTGISSPKNKTVLKTILKEKYASSQRRVKRGSNFQIPLTNFDHAFFSKEEIKQPPHEKLQPSLASLKHIKYPYYNTKYIHKHSPLRYSENLAYIPGKTPGGSEFYDSRSNIHCDEVVSNVDPIPDRIKNKMPDDDMDEDEREKRQVTVLNRPRRDNFQQNKDQPRLRGLGDKIDCFKEKYFGQNPLDSPFFDEGEIEPPEPIHSVFHFSTPIIRSSSSQKYKTMYNNPNIMILRTPVKPNTQLKPILHSPSFIQASATNHIIVPTTYKPYFNAQKSNNVHKITNLLTGESDKGVSKLKRNKFVEDKVLYGKSNKISLANVIFDKYALSKDPQMRVYGDIIGNIKANLNSERNINDTPASTLNTPLFIPVHFESTSRKRDINNFEKKIPVVLYKSFTNKEQIYNPNQHTRITRNNHFLYQPYKIITGNHIYTKKSLSPIFRPSPNTIKRLNIIAQASTSIESTVDINGQPVKRSAKVYKDIGRKERQITDSAEKSEEKESKVPDENVTEETVAKENKSLNSSDNNGDLDKRRGEPRYENGEATQYKNHKKHYSPVTTKTSITPEELNVEYLLKSTEDSGHVLDEKNNSNNTSTTDSSQNVFVTENIKSEEKNVSKNSTTDSKDENKSTFNTPHRFQGYRETSRQQIFDVSAFLPKIFVSGLPTHNYSSKYSLADKPKEDYLLAIPLNNINETKEKSFDSEITTQRYKNSESIRHTVEVRPSATIVPEVTITSRKPSTYVSTESIRLHKKDIERSSEIKSTSLRPPYRPIKRQRVKLTTTTRLPTTTYSDDDYDYYTTKAPLRVRKTSKKSSYRRERDETTPRYIQTTTVAPTTEAVTEYENKEKQAQEEPSHYEGGINYTEDETKNITEIPDEDTTDWRSTTEYESPTTTTSTTTERYYERTTRPRRVKRPHTRSRAQFDRGNSDDNLERHEVVSHKPRILEKTSKKRKTTVITNSKHYENNGSTPKKPRRKTNKKSNNSSRISSPDYENNEERKQQVEAPLDDEQLEIKETGRVVNPKGKYDDDNENDNSDEYSDDTDNSEEKKSEKLQQIPINEESRFEEDVEEEEVIQERPPSEYSKKDFGFYHDPDLAKQVNRLTDIKKEDQHPVHSDVEVFRADFKTNRGPKHGGNYKKMPSAKKIRKRLDEAGELDDLNVGSDLADGSLHGGNYRTAREEESEALEDKGISARVLNSFASLLPIIETTQKPPFEKDPGKRFYFFAKI